MSPLSVRARPSLEALADRLTPAVMSFAPLTIAAPDPGAAPLTPAHSGAESAVLPITTQVFDSGSRSDAGWFTPPAIAPQPNQTVTALVPGLPGDPMSPGSELLTSQQIDLLPVPTCIDPSGVSWSGLQSALPGERTGDPAPAVNRLGEPGPSTGEAVTDPHAFLGGVYVG
jgi:hypothetical protein